MGKEAKMKNFCDVYDFAVLMQGSKKVGGNARGRW
jgi:hypothetical protein